MLHSDNWYNHFYKWTPVEDSNSCSLLLAVAVRTLSRRILSRMDLQGQNQKIPKEGNVDTINLWVNEMSRLCQQIKL